MLFDLKYTASDATLYICADRTGTRLVLRVEDDGPGFPIGINTNALFAEFVRGARESAVPGVGLGLALSRRIVEAHGGSISASRREPNGARFEITLAAGEPPTIDLEDLA